MKLYPSNSTYSASWSTHEIKAQSAECGLRYESQVKELNAAVQSHRSKVQGLEQHLASYGKLPRTYPKGSTGARQMAVKRLKVEKELLVQKQTELQQLALSRAEAACPDLGRSLHGAAPLLEKEMPPASAQLELNGAASYEVQSHAAAPSMQKVEALLQSYGYGSAKTLPEDQLERVRNMRNDDRYLAVVTQALNKLRKAPHQDV